MSNYTFPNTRTYDTDLGFLIDKYQTLETNYNDLLEKYTALTNMIGTIAESGTFNQLNFNTSPDLATLEVGSVFYDSTYQSTVIRTLYGDLNHCQELVTTVINKTGSDIPALTPVVIRNTTGELATIEPVNASNILEGLPIGIVPFGGIYNNTKGIVQTQGYLHNINTSAWAVNTILYADTATGTLTHIKPSAGTPVLIAGQVIKQAGGTGGKIYTATYIKPSAGMIGYNNVATTLTADNLQGAIDELFTKSTIEDWISPSLINGYTGTIQYRKYKGLVQFKGSLIGGTGIAFTLPTGYRPDNNVIMPVFNTAYTFDNVTITSNGEFYGYEGGTLNTDNLSFSI